MRFINYQEQEKNKKNADIKQLLRNLQKWNLAIQQDLLSCLM
jgi:hypothetical protein